MGIVIWILIPILVLFFLSGIRIVRPTHLMLVETLGKYKRTSGPGFSWIFPVFQRSIHVNITEQMANAERQEVITKDRLNTTVDAVVFFKVMANESSVKASQYNVYDYENQIVTLARTTLRNIIGDMSYEDANSKRSKINTELKSILKEQVNQWGVEVLRTEMKEIDPPKDVQSSMNEVIKAENDKKAAIDYATAVETKADGARRAAIKEAQGLAEGKKLVADAIAYKTKVENEAARKYFVGNAQKLKNLEVTQASLENNSKVIITEKGIKPQLIIGELPLAKK